MTELEIMQCAKMYMDKLAQGIDPISDQEVPEDSVLNNVRLARCFFYVSDVLGQVIANGGRIGEKPKLQPFSIDRDQLLQVHLLSCWQPCGHQSFHQPFCGGCSHSR